MSTPASSELGLGHAHLREKVARLEAELGRVHGKCLKLEAELAVARQQIAWLSRQLMGPKAERVDPARVDAAWRAYCAELEAAANSRPASSPVPAHEDKAPLTSVQILLGLGGDDDLIQGSDSDANQGTAPTPTSPLTAPGEPDTEAKTQPDEEVGSPTPASAPAASGSSGRSDDEGPRKRKVGGRRRLPETLPTRYYVLEPDDLPPDAKRIGEKVSERLGFVPRHLERIVIVRPVYATKEGVEDPEATRTIKADPPAEMIPRGKYSPSALAHFIAEHFMWHTPWNRLSTKFFYDGVWLPKSTLSGVAVRAAPLARLVVDAMLDHARENAPALHIDPTSIRYMARGVCDTGAAWIRVALGLGVFVDFSRQLDGRTATPLLEGWACPGVMDGAQIFDAAERAFKFPRGGCWSHARRKLVYVSPNDPRALVGVKLISDLFDIEAEIRDLSPEDRLKVRVERSASIVQAIWAWRDGLLADPKLAPRHELAKALRYLRNQQERLTLFLQNGNVLIHNNNAELGARHIAVGRKDWLFLGSDAAAEAAGTWLSLILSAKLHDLGPEQYLRDLFRVLPEWPQTRLIELAPHNWKATAKRLCPVELREEYGPLTIPRRDTT